ncbi:lantibiotic dehydratase [Actinocorallia aurea]
MARPIFTARPHALARIPLLPELGSGVGSAELLDEAIGLASPSAQEAAEHSGPGSLTRRAYGIRAQARTTPHGVFAGVANAAFAETADLRLGSDHRTITYPDPAWLNKLVSEVVNDPDGMDEATVTTNNLTFERGDRYEIEPSIDGSTRQTMISIRATEVTRFVLESCRGGSRAATVLAELAARWPAGPAQRLLRELLDSGFLLHNLVPDDPRSDPLGHLLRRLPADSSHRQQLHRLRSLLIEADRHRPGSSKRLAFLIDALATAHDLMPADRILRADTAVDATVTLPTEVARKAAATASLLWRIGWGTDPLDDYHQRFLTRYGTARAVPLLELLDPVVGLGPVEETETIGAAADDPTRSAVLARLLADAAAHGWTEIVLDEEDVDRLTNRSPASAPRTAEIYFRLLADPTASCSFQIVVSGGSQDAGSTSHRFSPLLGVAPAPPPADGTAPVDAELVVRPLRASLASVSVQTSVAPCRIPIGVPPRPGDLDMAALMVFSDGHRFIVWSRLLGRPVRPVLYSRIALPLLPSAARFLAMAGHSGERPWHCWTWGNLKAPFTPAVRYRDAWLTSARWTLPHHLASAASSADRWDRALASWRRTVVPPLPNVVVTDDSDRQLVLDLSRVDDRELLRRYVRRGLAAVAAPPGSAGSSAVIPGPNGHHVLELVVSLDRASRQDDRPVPCAPSPRRAGDGLYLPGGPWLSLALQAPTTCQEPILTSLGRWIQDTPGDWDRWFWLRFHDSRHGEHFRVRFRGEPAYLYGTLLPSLSMWASDQQAQRLISGFCVEPYEQEIERYGGPDAITAAERFFDADSRLVLRLLSTTRREEQRLAAAAHAAVEIAARVGGAASLRRRLGRADHRRMNALRPKVRRAAPVLGDGWEAALDAYSTALDQPDEAIASDLIHMHCNRLAPGDELLVRALAADLIAYRVRLTEGSSR